MENNTFTVDTNVPTETLTDNLTSDEVDSLKVGEEIAEQQDQLLAGKYKDAAELEKAYKELEAKLGEQETEQQNQKKRLNKKHLYLTMLLLSQTHQKSTTLMRANYLQRL